MYCVQLMHRRCCFGWIGPLSWFAAVKRNRARFKLVIISCNGFNTLWLKMVGTKFCNITLINRISYRGIPSWQKLQEQKIGLWRCNKFKQKGNPIMCRPNSLGKLECKTGKSPNPFFETDPPFAQTSWRRDARTKVWASGWVPSDWMRLVLSGRWQHVNRHSKLCDSLCDDVTIKHNSTRNTQPNQLLRWSGRKSFQKKSLSVCKWRSRMVFECVFMFSTRIVWGFAT